MSSKDFSPTLFCDARLWLSSSNSFIKLNESFPESFGSFKERKERIDSEKTFVEKQFFYYDYMH